MASTTYKVWCVIQGYNMPFPVTILSNLTIGDLKDLIKNKAENSLRGVDVMTLILKKVRHHEPRENVDEPWGH
jgi:hypothetical protein